MPVLTTGHELIGARVARAFGKRCALGTITKWVDRQSAPSGFVAAAGWDEALVLQPTVRPARRGNWARGAAGESRSKASARVLEE